MAPEQPAPDQPIAPEQPVIDKTSNNPIMKLVRKGIRAVFGGK
jgi:hypothetical protein